MLFILEPRLRNQANISEQTFSIEAVKRAQRMHMIMLTLSLLTIARCGSRQSWLVARVLVMNYELIKMIHVGSVVLSYLLFTLRGFWVISQSSLLQKRWVKIMPHGH